MTASSPPKRRLRLALDLGADDLSTLGAALRSIAHDLEYEDREERETTSGGYSDGYHLELTCDPAMTGDLFREELEAWRQRSRE